MVARLLSENLDLVNGLRVATTQQSFRYGHLFGNRVLNRVVSVTFGPQFSDMLSGFKVFSRRFAKSFPVLSEGFEIETELTIFALEMRMPVAEIPVPYHERPIGSESKLSMVRDGIRIVNLISSMIKNERPLAFFSLLSCLFMAVSLSLGLPVVLEFLQRGFVPRLPTALLATGLALISGVLFTTGLVLDTVTRGRKEMKRIAYLSLPGPSNPKEE